GTRPGHPLHHPAICPRARLRNRRRDRYRPGPARLTHPSRDRRSHPLVLPAPCRDRRNRGADRLRHLRRTGLSLLGSLRGACIHGHTSHLLPGLRALLPGRTLLTARRPARPLHASARLRLRRSFPPAAVSATAARAAAIATVAHT